MMPESTAEAGAGATGWAVGSHPWSGNMPAFVPKPMISSIPAASTVLRPSPFPASFSTPPGAKEKEEIFPASRNIPSSAREAPSTE